MTSTAKSTPLVAIACGGTGGHLFPGLAVREQLLKYGCAVVLLISPKEIDRLAVKSEVRGGGAPDVVILPAVGLQDGNHLSFGLSALKSLFASWKLFRRRRPAVVLAMGGFTSAPPVFAAKDLGARTFLHESNAIPGRANRILSRFVDEAFVGFSEAVGRLKTRKVTVTGTPVRPQFQPREPAACRAALGLEPDRPVVLVVGGSQGAHGLNEMMLSALPHLAGRCIGGRPLQFLHLTGATDFEKVRSAYAARGVSAVVKPFLAEMELALGAATMAVSRAGASSLAELAAVQLPSLLVPFPAAADNHQLFNARALEGAGAARLLEQKNCPPEKTAAVIIELAENEKTRAAMRTALGAWHAPAAAEQIAGRMLEAIGRRYSGTDAPPVSEERSARVPDSNRDSYNSSLRGKAASPAA
jgi:UDP-N-acetylglucosamine--N-acetylmuramyl-(pentapeptide) pyrophosphoryl-undecaprenol N-acetylglucosamine transferase